MTYEPVHYIAVSLQLAGSAVAGLGLWSTDYRYGSRARSILKSITRVTNATVNVVVTLKRILFAYLGFRQDPRLARVVKEYSTSWNVEASGYAQEKSTPLDPKLTIEEKLAVLDLRSRLDQDAIHQIQDLTYQNTRAIDESTRKVDEVARSLAERLNAEIAEFALSGVRVTALGLILASIGTFLSYWD